MKHLENNGCNIGSIFIKLTLITSHFCRIRVIAPLLLDNFICYIYDNLSQVSHWPGGLCYETEAYRPQHPHIVLICTGVPTRSNLTLMFCKFSIIFQQWKKSRIGAIIFFPSRNEKLKSHVNLMNIYPRVLNIVLRCLIMYTLNHWPN